MSEDEHIEDDQPRAEVTAAEFKELFEAVSNWGRWGEGDERGALNELTADRIAAASRLVASGESVTLSLPLNTRSGIDNPEPADHRMTDVDIGSGTLRFAKDYVGVDYRNDGHSHIDALCHVAFDGALYNGKPSASITEDGATIDTIDVVKNGLIGRGVLLDVPRLRGVPWLEPGEHVFHEDLARAEYDQGVTVAEGDILLVRTGHARRRAELEPWDAANAKAGLHPARRPVPRRAACRSARLRREQQHRPEHDRGHRLSDSRLDPQRHGCPPARLPAIRGSRRRLRAERTLGVPLRRGAAAHSRRDRVAPQPDRDLLRDATPGSG